MGMMPPTAWVTYMPSAMSGAKSSGKVRGVCRLCRKSGSGPIPAPLVTIMSQGCIADRKVPCHDRIGRLLADMQPDEEQRVPLEDRPTTGRRWLTTARPGVRLTLFGQILTEGEREAGK